MKYSIIIPTYTPEESDFRRCLDYIKEQTLQPYEVIIVDDESPTEVPKIALEYGFKYIRHKKNKHNGGARNTGIRESTGDYLIFCNSDDYFEKDAVEQIDKVNNGEDLIIVGFRTFGVWKTGTEFIPNKNNTPNISKYQWNGEALHVVNRKFILENKLFELENVPIADRDWTLRLEKCIKTFTFVPKILYNYQVGHKGAIMTDIIEGRLVSNLMNPDFYVKKEETKEDTNIELLIYEHAIPEVGGNTTFLLDYIAHISKYFNITVLFKTADPYRLEQVQKYATTVRYRGQEVETDILMWNSSWGVYPDTIKFKRKKPIQMLHANYREVFNDTGFRFKIPDIEYEYIAVSQHVADVFYDMYKIKSKVIPNMLFPEVKADKVLEIITCTRLVAKKGLKRIIKFAQELDKRNKKYLWFIYGTGNDSSSIQQISKYKDIILRDVRFDLTSFIAHADYMFHFSDTEGDPYCTKEALQVNTPCVTTAYPATYEQITDKKNGYILPFELFEKGTEKEWDEAIDKIYNNIPKFEYENKDKEHIKEWLKILGKPVGKLRPPKVQETVDIKIKRAYPDVQLKRVTIKGEIISVHEDRAEEIIKKGYAEYV